MAQVTKTLSVVLVLQLVLAVWLQSKGSGMEAFQSDTPLLKVDMAQVDELKIEQKDKDPLVLSKKDGKWVIPALADAPVDAAKIEDLSENLFSITRPYPVGRTASAAKQFKVTDKDFEKKLTLSKGGQVVDTLYLGSSPGFKRVHAKVASQDPVYAIAYSSYALAPTTSMWVDSSLLHLDRSKVSSISFKDMVFKRNDGEVFVLEGLADNEVMNEQQVSSFLSSVLALPFEDILGTEEKPIYQQEAPALQYTVNQSEGDPVTMTISGPLPDDENAYVVKSSAQPYYFKVRKAQVEKVRGFERKQFVTEKKEEAPAQAAVDTTVERAVSDSGEGSAAAAVPPVADKPVDEQNVQQQSDQQPGDQQ